MVILFNKIDYSSNFKASLKREKLLYIIFSKHTQVTVPFIFISWSQDPLRG